MTCLEMGRILPPLAEREGTPRVALEAARHLAMCPSCAGELLRLREVNGLLDRLPRAEVPASFPRYVLRAIRTKGGAVVIVLLVLALGALGSGLAAGPSVDTIASALRDPLETAGTAMAALVAGLFALIGPARGALGEAPTAPLELGRPLPSGAPGAVTTFLLVLAAALFLAGSWAAFGFVAGRLLRETDARDPAPR